MPTIGEVEECIYAIEWTIRDFFSIPAQVDKSYYSPSFPFADASWNLEMYPNGQTEGDSEGSIDLFLNKESDGPPVELNYSFGIKTYNDEITQVRHLTFNFKEKAQSYGYFNFLDRSLLMAKSYSFASSGHLTFVCRLKQIHPTHDAKTFFTACAHCNQPVDRESLALHEKKCLNKPIKCPECSEVVTLKDWHGHECQPSREKSDNSISVFSLKDKILDDFKHLSLNPENCDVVLRVKGREFQAHKAILTARSPVLASTFRSNIKQNATCVVDIEDCDPSTFSDFLRYLYCEDATFRLSKENVLNLFAVANKYGVLNLSTKCLEFIKEILPIGVLDHALTPCHSETEPIELAAA